MPNTKSEKYSALFGLAILAFLLWLAFLFAKWTFVSLLGLDAKIAAAIIAACATALISVGTVVYTQRRISAREIADAHRKEKAEVYKRFMQDAVVGILKASKRGETGSEETQRKLEDLFFDFTGDLIVWGSPAVIRAFNAFRDDSTKTNIIVRLDGLIMAMRADLGNDNASIKPGDLIKMFINDPQNFDAALAESKNGG